MSADPYAPPRAALELPRNDPPMPGGIAAQIMCGVCAATLSGVFTLLSMLRTFSRDTPPVYLVYNLIAASVILGFSYGIFRGSRTCAVLALSSFLLPRLVAISHGVSTGWPLALIMVCCHVLSVIGTVRWHRLRIAHRRALA